MEGACSSAANDSPNTYNQRDDRHAQSPYSDDLEIKKQSSDKENKTETRGRGGRPKSSFARGGKKTNAYYSKHGTHKRTDDMTRECQRLRISGDVRNAEIRDWNPMGQTQTDNDLVNKRDDTTKKHVPEEVEKKCDIDLVKDSKSRNPRDFQSHGKKLRGGNRPNKSSADASRRHRNDIDSEKTADQMASSESVKIHDRAMSGKTRRPADSGQILDRGDDSVEYSRNNEGINNSSATKPDARSIERRSKNNFRRGERQLNDCYSRKRGTQTEGSREGEDVRNMKIKEWNPSKNSRGYYRGGRQKRAGTDRQITGYHHGFQSQIRPEEVHQPYIHNMESQDARYWQMNIPAYDNTNVPSLMTMQGQYYNSVVPHIYEDLQSEYYDRIGNSGHVLDKRNQLLRQNDTGDFRTENVTNIMYETASLNINATPFVSSGGQGPDCSKVSQQAVQDLSHYGSLNGGTSNRKYYNYNREIKTERYPSKKRVVKKKFDDSQHSVQASVLAEQLYNGTYECMVCCETLKCSDSVWNCGNCFHIFHLNCIRKWARSATAVVEGDNSGWRCPACQNVVSQVPNIYRCFCGKVRNPLWNPRSGLTPHSCGELCKKKRELSACSHHCNQLCHPGPCPTCPVMVKRTCPCGGTQAQMRCGNAARVKCTLVCNKVLNCGKHECQQICHEGSCNPCDIKVEQNCYCGKESQVVSCGTGHENDNGGGHHSCNEICKRTLDCQNHNCDKICHPGKCEPCELQPSLLTHCPCGKVPIDELLKDKPPRVSCLDLIPTCQYQCGKTLPCGKLNLVQGCSKAVHEHCCKLPCHTGKCGSCDGLSLIRCRCKSSTKEIPCKEIIESEMKEYLCDKRCNKKRNCGRHRCSQKCCVDTEHNCDLVCGKKLRCGIHKCEELCHARYCPPCWQAGFDELTCHCGATILYPPIPCGTKPPECDKPCTRVHSCSHPVNHMCHNEETCPPCTVLIKTWCMGKHEIRQNIPCHTNDVSCGHPCGKPLPCNQHFCLKLCHKGECLEGDETCRQPCKEPRKECGHACGAPCHAGKPCPAISCKVKVPVSCKCGHRKDTTICMQGGDKSTLAQVYQRFTTANLANKMRDMQSGHSVDITAIVRLDDPKNRLMECNDECAILERNRRVAEALQIDETKIRSSQQINYSLFLQDEARKNLQFVKSVEDALENLVSVTIKLHSEKRSHSFSPMNSSKRQLIHELSPYYGCTSVSYDQEPFRSTIVTATRASRLPPQSLSSQISRELNPPPPPPVPFLPSDKSSSRNDVQTSASLPKSKMDYFADDLVEW